MATRNGNLLGGNGTSFLNLADGDRIAYDANYDTFINRPVVRPITIDPTTATVNLDWANGDVFYMDGIAQATSFNFIYGTPFAGQRISLYLKDNGTGRVLSWNGSAGGFRAYTGITLPLLTVAYYRYWFDMVYNANDNIWDVIATALLED
jgi:hypothetical protein